MMLLKKWPVVIAVQMILIDTKTLKRPRSSMYDIYTNSTSLNKSELSYLIFAGFLFFIFLYIILCQGENQN